MSALDKVWFKIFKVDFYESIIDYAVINASRGITEDELLRFLQVRGFENRFSHSPLYIPILGY